MQLLPSRKEPSKQLRQTPSLGGGVATGAVVRALNARGHEIDGIDAEGKSEGAVGAGSIRVAVAVGLTILGSIGVELEAGDAGSTG